MKKVTDNTKTSHKTLRNAGSKATPSRLLVLEALQESHKPLSISDIETKIKKVANESTIYRIVEAFQKSGLVRKVELGKNHSYYEFADRPHHHHIICNNCGDIEDIENTELEKALHKTKNNSKKFKIVDKHLLEFFGLCKVCAK